MAHEELSNQGLLKLGQKHTDKKQLKKIQNPEENLQQKV
jgi:hypothetical protein